jgi:hypothetical protein
MREDNWFGGNLPATSDALSRSGLFELGRACALLSLLILLECGRTLGSGVVGAWEYGRFRPRSALSRAVGGAARSRRLGATGERRRPAERPRNRGCAPGVRGRSTSSDSPGTGTPL